MENISKSFITKSVINIEITKNKVEIPRLIIEEEIK